MKRMNKVSTILLASMMVLSGLAIIGVQNASAITFVDEDITDDTNWTKEGSPYVVAKKISITEGATLYIDHGVEVRVGEGLGIKIVNGNLDATGTNSDKIVFTSNKLNPSPGDWDSIRLIGESTMFMENCVVKYGEYGVALWGYVYNITKCEFVDNSEAGIYHLGYSSNYGYGTIENNVIKHNKYGVCTDSIGSKSWIYLMGNEIVDNSDYGVYIVSDRSIHHIIIHDNKISSCRAGVYIYGRDDVYDIELYNNTIIHNENGIDIRSSDENIFDVDLLYNDISFNGVDGVHFRANDKEIYNIDFFKNNISSNSDDGVYFNSEKKLDGIRFSGDVLSYNNGNGAHLITQDDICDIKFYNTIISHNTNNGISIYTIHKIYDMIFSNNSITYNGYYSGYLDDTNGIKIKYPVISGTLFEDNTIASNYGCGIRIKSREESLGPHITLNNIFANQVGIYLSSSGDATVINNSVYNNSKYGIEIYYGYYDINFNNIYQNIDAGVYLHGWSNKGYADMERNYWGDPSGPYHESINPTGLGDSIIGDPSELDFIPFLTSFLIFHSEPPITGDLNDDNKLTPADAVIALQLVASGGWDANADVSGDDRVTSIDVLMILQAAAGAISL